MSYTEDQLTPWFKASQKPKRGGWYLVTNSDEEYVQSERAPQFTFAGTVWRYWDGYKWMWFGEAVFTNNGTDGVHMWREAVIDPWSHWRGLREVFGFRIA